MPACEWMTREDRRREVEAKLELYRLWVEAGCPQDVTGLVEGLGIVVSEGEAAAVVPDAISVTIP